MRTCPTCQRRYVDSQMVCPLDQAALGADDGTKPAGSLGKVLGSYKLISLLGKGGMGSIYIGAHTRLNRFVAIKLPRRELDNRPEHVARFLDEARTINRIKHENIVESLDLVEDVVDGAYCVMELLVGPDLKTRIAEGPLPIDSAIEIGAQIADALAAVHALDIVHRDVKPENVILIQRGEREIVKLIDFGVAQVHANESTGSHVGTAAYMAPEQAAGQRVTGRADLYALGVVLFEMVVGDHPFPSSTDSEYLLRHHDDVPPAPSELREMPAALEAVILRLLAKDPADRFASAATVAEALRAIDLDVSETVHPAPTPRKSSGKGTWVAVAVLALGGAAAALIVPRYLDAQADAQPTPAARAMAAPPVAARPTEATTRPPQAPAGPELVTIELTSTPKGATVTREGETVPLGVTPFTASLVRSDKPSLVRVELAGYESRDLELALTESTKITIDLPRIAAVVSKQPAKGMVRKKPEGDTKKPTKVQREGVMDPFAN